MGRSLAIAPALRAPLEGWNGCCTAAGATRARRGVSLTPILEYSK